jgi:4'-phosphopantetheinyl transferase
VAVERNRTPEKDVSLDDFIAPGNRPGAPVAGEPIALPGAAPGVALWWSDLAHDAVALERGAAWLSPAETARAARFGTDALRRRYVAGRSSLRLVLGRALGIDPAAVPIRRGPRGRPELALGAPAPDFNISHTGGGAVIGVAPGLPPGVRIGVDVERRDRSLAADRLARKFLSAQEQALLQDLDADQRRLRFLRTWTCKEAMSKATGDGLVAPFARLTVDVDAGVALISGPPPYTPEAWRLHALAVPSGFFATLAVWRPGRDAPSDPRP